MTTSWIATFASPFVPFAPRHRTRGDARRNRRSRAAARRPRSRCGGRTGHRASRSPQIVTASSGMFRRRRAAAVRRSAPTAMSAREGKLNDRRAAFGHRRRRGKSRSRHERHPARSQSASKAAAQLLGQLEPQEVPAVGDRPAVMPGQACVQPPTRASRRCRSISRARASCAGGTRPLGTRRPRPAATSAETRRYRAPQPRRLGARCSGSTPYPTRSPGAITLENEEVNTDSRPAPLASSRRPQRWRRRAVEPQQAVWIVFDQQQVVPDGQVRQPLPGGRRQRRSGRIVKAWHDVEEGGTLARRQQVALKRLEVQAVAGCGGWARSARRLAAAGC